MKESRVLKILSYVLIPIFILNLIFCALYGICKEKFITTQISESEYFTSDLFLSDYMNDLKIECNNLIYNHDRYTQIQDGEYEISYKSNNDKYNYEIKDLYYLIIYENFVLTNVELTADTNSIEKLIKYISTQDSKTANIINGEVIAESEIIQNKAIQYFDNFIIKYYKIVNDVVLSEETDENNTAIYSYGKQNYETSIEDFKIYSSYKEQLVESADYKIYKDLIKKVQPYENLMIYSVPISGILITIMFIYLIISHIKNKEGIDLNDFDKIPIEIIFIVIGILVGLIIYFTILNFENLNECFYTGGISVFLLSYFVSYILCCLAMVTLIKRIKAKILFKESIIGNFCIWCSKFIKKLFKKIKKIYTKIKITYKNIVDSWSIILKISLMIVAYFILAFCFLLIFEDIGFILDLFILAYILYKLFENISCYQKIENHLKAMYKGEHPPKLNKLEFTKYFKNIVEYVNDISRGYENAIEEGIKSERLKTELITNVSHDIKTPLTSIINYVDLIKKEEINNDKAKEYIEILDNKSQRLKKLTEDLVEASKASSGNVKLNIEKININIITQIPNQILYINADNRYMYRIIENLFSNISKYALENSRVYIDVKKELNIVKIDIKNISKEKLNISADELIQRFVRGDRARTTEGSGLGISISKSLTEIQNGVFELQIDGDLFKVHLEFNIVN